MDTLIHDLPVGLEAKADKVIAADGRYAPCQGCFRCWTRHPASCRMADSLHEVCRTIGLSDNLTIVTENCYGGYSPRVKNILDRSIGTSTPLSTYRGRQMHHTLRYGRHDALRVLVYGDMTEEEKDTWRIMVERNRINQGFRSSYVEFFETVEEAEKKL